MVSARFRPLLLVAMALFFSSALTAAEVKLLLPLQRSAYQTNEWIDVSVVRGDKQPLAAGTLTLTLKGTDGSSVITTFPAPAAALQGPEARRVEHMHLNGWLLRPGKYALEAAVDGAKAVTEIELVNHVRQSSFRLINWGRAQKEQQLVQGEDSLGFNLFYGDETKDHLLRAGVDAMGVCVMSGGHQMDLRTECDWSDPYVVQGGTRRVVRRALADRTRPNVPGVHFYDEPGLTWHKHPVTGDFTPHEVPAQVRSFQAAFGKEPLPHHKLDPKNPDDLARWKHWSTWKLGLMDAAWKDSQLGVAQVRPDYLSLTQSQYGWGAFCDGYYFNVARSLPITSGHGGYHDFGLFLFNPSYTLEMARARDRWKPCWYLPTWYGNTTSDQFRLEQYLSFQTGIQGLMSPPDLEPAVNASARAGIVETNQLLKRLGPIFTTMPPTKPPVAMLYSLSQAIHTQAHSKGKKNYIHEMPQGLNLGFTYIAGRVMQQPFLPVLDEDVLDGSVAGDHKAIVLTSLDYLDPPVITALEDFAAKGGLVLLTGDSTVTIKGATKLGVVPRLPQQDQIDELEKQLKTLKDKQAQEALQRKLVKATSTAQHVAGALVLAKAIKVELDKKGIKPLIECDVPTIVTTRHSAGDVEYLFLVNATPDDDATDAKGNPDRITPKAVTATIALPDDGRPVSDAILGEPATGFVKKGDQLVATLRFGPGQMRVFVRTPEGIAGVRLSRPVLARDLTLEQSPLRLDIAATVLAPRDHAISGSIPLHVRVLDPFGGIRHELFRATKQGQFAISLPLAANDPAGTWKVEVRELLEGKTGETTFDYAPPSRARAIAGASERAVTFGDDRDKAFRFARTFHEVTIIKGKSPFNNEAAKRLSKVLEPWGIQCKELDLVEAAKARTLSAEQAETWVGLTYASKGQIKAGDKNPPIYAGFNVRGPVILLGNPQDHALIEFLAKEKFLPYAPDAAYFPGPGRGHFAWQQGGVGPLQESLTLIAYDDAGMAEAVGSLYEAMAGIAPLTKRSLPTSDALTPASSNPAQHPAAKLVWSFSLPQSVVSLKAVESGVSAVAPPGSRVVLSPGKAFTPELIATVEFEKLAKEAALVDPNLAKSQSRPDRMVKLTAPGQDLNAVAYWGGTLRIVDKAGAIRAEQQLPQDATALAWQGARLIVGLADGRVLALEMPKQ